MERTVFLNGEFMPEGKATVPIFDRGLLFADSVYEGWYPRSQIVDYEYHMNRLGRSLGELDMPWPMSRDELLVAMMKLIEMNNAVEGFMYLQVTRGSRDAAIYMTTSTSRRSLPLPRRKNLPPTRRRSRWRWRPRRTSAGPAAISRPPICWGR